MNTIKVGITGQNGFIGYHLLQTLNLYPKEFENVAFKRCYWESENAMDTFVSKCDVIVHLAALNRHNDSKVIYSTNIKLTKNLLAAIRRTSRSPHLIISSTTQEEHDNLYGKSKRLARKLISDWANQTGATFTGMIIPNVFGPFGNPYYNSVVATFSHQVAHNEQTRIDVDGQLKLIYIDELVELMINCIRNKTNEHHLAIKHTSESKVSKILALLNNFKSVYQNGGEIPELNTKFEYNLFNTFRCYMPKDGYFPRYFKKHVDNRGHFVELMRSGISGQTSFSTTMPNITRGNHFHTRKMERFAVIQGKALIQLRRIGTREVLNFELNGNKPSYVDMPIWYTHNITNIGKEELITVFWINEPYDQNDPDTWFEKTEIK